MDIDDAIRGRRTHKSFEPEPVPPALLDELLELARWAPNHHLTEPWRFRVLGPRSLERLKEAAGPSEAPKLDRAPTLVAASVVLTGAQQQDEEDLCAAACAIYAVLLGAHARGLAGYWRTPGVLRVPAGRAAIGIPGGERVLGLVHLGAPRTAPATPGRRPVQDYVAYLD
ncbi:MAG TPA: nitroreductase family protein [Gaiellaceae bacterium]|nr:nitroreductase family protein [Gaiellaceae bacterium]